MDWLKGMCNVAHRKESERMKQYVTAQEIAETLGVSLTKSYDIIRRLNAELESKGYLTVRGKTSRAFFEEKLYIGKQVS